MALTRVQIETVITRRIGSWLTTAGRDGTTVDGTNADLADPIAWALRLAGYSVADPSSPSGGEIAAVATADVDKILDLTELRALLNTYRNFADVDSVAGPVGAKLDQLRQGMARSIAEKRAEIADTYGIGGASAYSVLPTRADGYAELAALE